MPEGFQRSEFLPEHGAIDMIVDRREMRDRIAALLSMLMHSRREGTKKKPEVKASVPAPHGAAPEET